MARRRYNPQQNGVYRKSDYDRIYRQEKGIYSKSDYESIRDQLDREEQQKKSELDRWFEERKIRKQQEKQRQYDTSAQSAQDEKGYTRYLQKRDEQQKQFNQSMHNYYNASNNTNLYRQAQQDVMNGFQPTQLRAPGLPRPQSSGKTPYQQAQEAGRSPYVTPEKAAKVQNDRVAEQMKMLEKQREEFNQSMHQYYNASYNKGLQQQAGQDAASGFVPPSQREKGLPRKIGKSPYQQAQAAGGRSPYVTPEQAIENQNQKIKKAQQAFDENLHDYYDSRYGMRNNQVQGDVASGFTPRNQRPDSLPRPKSGELPPYMQADKAGRSPYVPMEQAIAQADEIRARKQKEAYDRLGLEGVKQEQQPEEKSKLSSRLTVQEYLNWKNKTNQDVEAGMFSGQTDPMKVRDKDLPSWTKAMKGRADVQENMAENAQTAFQMQTKPAQAWGEVFDYIEALDEQNEEKILSWGTTSDEEKANAQRTLDTLRQTAKDRRDETVTNMDDYFRVYYEGDNNLASATPEEKREILYNSFMPDEYEDRVANMTPEQKEELDSLIDRALAEMENNEVPSWREYETDIEGMTAESKYFNQRAAEGKAEQERREKVHALEQDANIQQYSGEYDPSLIPEAGWMVTDDHDIVVLTPRGTEAEKIYYWMNNVPGPNDVGNYDDYNQMAYFATPKQREIFNQWFKYDKEHGTNTAMAYYDGIKAYLSAAKSEYDTFNIQLNSEDPFQGTVMRIGGYIVNPMVGLVGTAGSVIGGIEKAIGAKGSATDPNSNWYKGTKVISISREHQNEIIENFAHSLGVPKGVANFLMNVGDSILDNLVAMGYGNTLSGANVARTKETVDRSMRIVQLLMSGEATSNTMMRNLEAGKDPTEAALYAIGDGVIEWITEKYSLEQIMRPDVKEMMGSKWLKRKFLAKATAAEGSEEIAADVLNLGLDSVLSVLYGHENEIQAAVNDLVVNENMSEQDALKQVWKDKLWQIGLSGIAGALSGYVLGKSRLIYNSLQEKTTGRLIKTNDSLTKQGDVESMLEKAKQLGAGTESQRLAAEIEERIRRKKTPTNAQLGRLAQTMAMEAQEQLQNQGSDITEKAVREALKEKGVKLPGKLAKIITKVQTQGMDSLTKSEQAALNAEKSAQETLLDLTKDSELSRKLQTELDEKTKGLQDTLAETSNLMRGRTSEGIDTKTLDMYLANEDDLRRVEGQRINSTREVIVNGRVGTIVKTRTVTEGTGDKTRTVPRFIVNVDGKTQEVSASEIKATGFAAAAVIREMAVEPDVYTGRYTDLLMKQIEDGKVKNVGQYLADAWKIRWSAITGEAMPQTGMQEDVAKEIYRTSLQDRTEMWDNYRKSNPENFKGAGKGTVRFGTAEYGTPEFDQKIEKYDAATKERIGFVANIAKMSGLDLRIEDESTVKNWRIHGSQSSSGIMINLDSYDRSSDAKAKSNRHHIVVTLGHEMTHWLKQNNLSGYLELQDYVVKKLRESGADVAKLAYDTIQGYRRAGKSINMMEAIDEVVANACDQVLGSKETEAYLKQHNTKLYKKIRDYVRYLVKKIRGIANGMEFSASTEAQAIARYGNELSKLWLGKYDEVLNGKVKAWEGFKFGDQVFTQEQVQESEQLLQEAMAKPVENFSMRMPVEMRTDGLIAVHNLDERGLRSDLKMKGFPMPSIAVRSQEKSWVAYGKISIYFGRNSVDPAIAGNRMYKGDAYTATLGDAQVETAEDALEVLRSKPERDFQYAYTTLAMFQDYKKVRSIDEARSKAFKYRNSITENNAEWMHLKAMDNELMSDIQEYLYKHYKVRSIDPMLEHALGYGMLLTAEELEQNPGMKPREVYAAVERSMKKAFAEEHIEQYDLGKRGHKIYDKIIQFVTEAGQMQSAGMLEAKPNRILSFKEVTAALLPESVDEDLVRELVDAGVEESSIYYYSESDKLRDRETMQKQIPRIEGGVAFSMARDVDTSDWKTFETRDGEMYSRDQKGNVVRLTGLDREYVEAWYRSDFARMEEILADKIRENGAVPFKAPNAYSTPNHRWIANAIKNGDEYAIQRAAAEMAEMVPDNAVLIPMPNHHGRVDADTDTMVLAQAISEITGRPVIKALEGVERESRKADKAKPKSQQMKAADLGFRQVMEIQEGTVPYIVDNVVASGLTAQAAHEALGNRGITLAYAKGTLSANDGLKRANVTFYDTNKQYGQYLIPLSERIDMSKKGYAGTKYSMSITELSDQYDQAYENYDDEAGEQIIAAAAELAMPESKIRDKNGRLKVVYHQTNADPFTVFDISKARTTSDIQGAYFAPNYDKYHEYGDRTYAVYLDIRKPAIDPEGPDLSKTGEGTRVMLDLIEQGYDGVIRTDENGEPYEYIAFYPEQIKSAEPFTEDDDHTLIPLMQRFNKWEKDIRWSYSEDTGTPEIQTKDGRTMAVELPGGSFSMYSLTSWQNDDIDELVRMLVQRGFSERKVKKWVKDVNGIAAIIASDRARYDYKAAPNAVMLKNNAEYVRTLDASTLCAKRLLYQGIFNEIQHMLPNTPIMPEDLIKLTNKMKANGFVTPCSLCYVESRRKMLGVYASKWLKTYEGAYKPKIDELTTTDGLTKLQEEHPQAYDDFVAAMNAKGTANPKVVQLRTDYKSGEIRKLTAKQIEKVKSIGGLRIQSFSDFETVHMIDMMQAVMDMAAMDLTSQAYTKVPNFAWIFGGTGIKINLSLIGEGTGLDEHGNLIFSDTEGMPFKDAMELRKAYSKNVGTILVGTRAAGVSARWAWSMA